MPLPEGVAACMLKRLRGMPDPPMLVTRSEALAVVEEQEVLGGCTGPLCRGILESLGAEPVEAAYAITPTGLVPVGFGGLEIDGETAVNARGIPGYLGLFHTHPAGIVIPTPYDLAGAKIRGSRVECVGARAWGKSKVMCIEAGDPGMWEKLAGEFVALESKIMATDYYTPYIQDGSLVFVPHPSPQLALEIEHEALAIADSLGFNAYIIEDVHA